MSRWVSKGGLAGAKRHDSKHDMGLAINPTIAQTKSTCYMNLTGIDRKPLHTGNRKGSINAISKPKSCTKKAGNVDRCNRIEARFMKAFNDRKYAKSPAKKTRKKFKDNIQVWRAN